MRTFVALPLPVGMLPELGDMLGALRANHPAHRWTRADNLHVTVAFLGDVDKAGVGILTRAMADVAAVTAPIAVRLGSPITLPKGRPANVLALDFLEGRAEIAALAARVEAALVTAGEEARYAFRTPERRPFTPHLTIARKGSGPLFVTQDEQHRELPLGGIMDKLVVFRSELFHDGPIYTALAEFGLTNGQ
jgi:2'-5' RNA ligase